MSHRAFSTAQAADLTGLSVRQLDYWAQKGIFTPGVQSAQGSGSRKKYSLEDIIALRSLRHLKCRHWSTQKLRRALTMLREVMQDPNPLRRAMLIADKTTLLAVYKTKQGEQALLDALDTGGQHILSLVIETVEEETQQLLLNLSEQDNHHDGH